MDKRKYLSLVILFFLYSCTKTPTQFQVLATSTESIASSAISKETDVTEILAKTPTLTKEPTNALRPTTASNPFRTATVTPPLDSFVTDLPEPILNDHPVMTPIAPLDPKSYRSVLDWIKFSFANQDLSIIEDLALDKVLYGISEAEYTAVLTKDELVKNLTMHLAQDTQCLAYTFREGEINSLDIFIANWEPDWEYQGRKTDDLIFHLSNQRTPDSGLSLVVVALPHAYDQDYVSEIFEHMCFE